MAKVNKKSLDYRKDFESEHRLAGGYGPHAAKQDAEALLRRAVMANLLWEDLFYEDGQSVVDNIRALIPQVPPDRVAAIAIEARTQQKLRHVPLLIAREMARLPEHKGLVGDLLPQIITRADQLTEFVALYWQEKKEPLSAQVKDGLAAAFRQFSEYNLAKYNRDEQVKLRDVLMLCHPKPKDKEQEALWKRLLDKQLAVPDTWEVALSAGKDKKAIWERLITEEKLGALAFVRNLRNMEEIKVDPTIISKGFAGINPGWLLPLNFLAAAKAAPRWERELEAMMLRGLAEGIKLPGYSILIVDVSGSMGERLSAKGDFTRLSAAAAITMLAAEACERIAVYVTAGNDGSRRHKTEFLPPRRGFALSDAIVESSGRMGGGGIFTRQCLEYVKAQEREQPDRIMVFSDSQDCDAPGSQVPAPFGKRNYIIDISSHAHGVNYKGIWTAEITGWSEKFIDFIAALEGVSDSNFNNNT